MAKTARQREYVFDRGDWIAARDRTGQYRLRGKVVDADSESITVENRAGVREHYAVGEDPIAHVRWTGGGRWTVR